MIAEHEGNNRTVCLRARERDAEIGTVYVNPAWNGNAQVVVDQVSREVTGYCLHLPEAQWRAIGKAMGWTIEESTRSSPQAVSPVPESGDKNLPSAHGAGSSSPPEGGTTGRGGAGGVEAAPPSTRPRRGRSR